MPGMRRNVDDRRLATLRVLAGGPVSWQEIVEAVGTSNYSQGEAARYSVHLDVKWLRSVGCAISVRGNAQTGKRYVLESAPPDLGEGMWAETVLCPAEDGRAKTYIYRDGHLAWLELSDEEQEALIWLGGMVANGQAPIGAASLLAKIRRAARPSDKGSNQ
jgi:hypothetical protein